MKKLFTIVSMTLIIPALTSCGGGPKGDMPWIVDRFDDIKVIRYEVPGFDALPLEEKELIYYLSEAAKCGRDILFDQNCPVNLPVRRTLETVYENYKGDRTTAEWKALEKYLKKVWFANGIHHHYSNDKFVPEFTEGYLLDAIETIPEEKFGSLNSLRAEDSERMERYGKLADDLHTDLHECLGHGSGQLAPGVKGGELKSYGSTLEETRADLFGLYYLGDPKLVELGLIPSLDVAKAGYAKYILNGMMTQLARIEPGKNVEESHMRNRKLICEWCYERGKADKVIELVKENGKTYAVVNDFGKLRDLFGQMLREVQRIKSEGDYEAGKALVEQYAVTVDPELHKEVRDRYYALDIEPYGGFVNPEYELVEKDGRIVDVKISYPADYVGQMLGYAKDYSFLPNIN